MFELEESGKTTVLLSMELCFWWIVQTMKGRLLESKAPDTLMTDETIANVPVLIVGNKINRPEAIS